MKGRGNALMDMNMDEALGGNITLPDWDVWAYFAGFDEGKKIELPIVRDRFCSTSLNVKFNGSLGIILHIC